MAGPFGARPVGRERSRNGKGKRGPGGQRIGYDSLNGPDPDATEANGHWLRDDRQERMPHVHHPPVPFRQGAGAD